MKSPDEIVRPESVPSVRSRAGLSAAAKHVGGQGGLVFFFSSFVITNNLDGRNGTNSGGRGLDVGWVAHGGTF